MATCATNHHAVILSSLEPSDPIYYDKLLDDTQSTVTSEASDDSTELDSVVHDGDGGFSRNVASMSMKSVLFSTVEIREYDRVVGDHTDLIGPPLAIGWDYEERMPISLLEFEENRSPRRPQWELMITPTGRRQILMDNWGYTSKELSKEEKNLVNQRLDEEKKSKKKAGVVQKAKRKLKKSLSVALTALVPTSETSYPAAPSTGGSTFGVVSYAGM